MAMWMRLAQPPLLQGNERTLEEEIVKEASMDFFKVSYLHGLVMSI